VTVSQDRTLAGADDDYRAAIEFLYGFTDYERTSLWTYDPEHFNPDRLFPLLDALGNPHRHGWFVHVAGTNGKGSVCAMTASALREAGLRVGLYTSPHLITFRERIRIDGALITRGEVIESVGRLRHAARLIEGLTFFDVWTALAFDHFARKEVDAAVIEVVMGGRLDSTNVITPAVSVIASVSMDHRGRLGETIEEIASEKAGIIKPGIPAVSAPQTPDAAAVIEARAMEMRSGLIVGGRDVTWERNRGLLNFHGRRWSLDGIRLPLAGEFQFENAATALAALESLESSGYPVDSTSAMRGIELARWPGRMETIAHSPDIVVDGACNTGAMAVVADSIALRSPRDTTVAVVAMCRDKEIGEVLAILGRAASRMVFTGLANPRIMDAAGIAANAPTGVTSLIEPDTAKALKLAVEMAGDDGLVLVTGSLYLVGEVFRIRGIGETEHPAG
jgi:dihydrofolate synthase / folylpolyglutamate synthase